MHSKTERGTMNHKVRKKLTDNDLTKIVSQGLNIFS